MWVTCVSLTTTLNVHITAKNGLQYCARHKPLFFSQLMSACNTAHRASTFKLCPRCRVLCATDACMNKGGAAYYVEACWLDCTRGTCMSAAPGICWPCCKLLTDNPGYLSLGGCVTGLITACCSSYQLCLRVLGLLLRCMCLLLLGASGVGYLHGTSKGMRWYSLVLHDSIKMNTSRIQVTIVCVLYPPECINGVPGPTASHHRPQLCQT